MRLPKTATGTNAIGAERTIAVTLLIPRTSLATRTTGTVLDDAQGNAAKAAAHERLGPSDTNVATDHPIAATRPTTTSSEENLCGSALVARGPSSPAAIIGAR